jgi:hypothetical protein
MIRFFTKKKAVTAIPIKKEKSILPVPGSIYPKAGTVRRAKRIIYMYFILLQPLFRFFHHFGGHFPEQILLYFSAGGEGEGIDKENILMYLKTADLPPAIIPNILFV